MFLVWMVVLLLQMSGFSSTTSSNVAVSSSGNCVYNVSTMTNGDAGLGPLRCGIFATATSTRAQAGASFYGILELSGNVAEHVINLHGTGATNVFTRSWGNGALSAAGNHDEATWPLWTFVQANGINNMWCQRGGSFAVGANELQISDRTRSFNSLTVNGKGTTWTGGRGVR